VYVYVCVCALQACTVSASARAHTHTHTHTQALTQANTHVHSTPTHTHTHTLKHANTQRHTLFHILQISQRHVRIPYANAPSWALKEVSTEINAPSKSLLYQTLLRTGFHTASLLDHKTTSTHRHLPHLPMDYTYTHNYTHTHVHARTLMQALAAGRVVSQGNDSSSSPNTGPSAQDVFAESSCTPPNPATVSSLESRLPGYQVCAHTSWRHIHEHKHTQIRAHTHTHTHTHVQTQGDSASGIINVGPLSAKHSSLLHPNSISIPDTLSDELPPGGWA
jgi:hypothetical protein